MINVNGKQITVSTNKIYQLAFLKEVVLNCYTRSNDWLSSQSTLFEAS